MKKVLSILMAALLTVCLLFALTACGGKSDVEDIKSAGKIIIGVTDYAPFDYQKDGEWIGFDADMAKLLGEKLGVDVEFIEIDWENKVTELKSGKIDLIWNGMTMTDELAKEMDFSLAYAQNSQVIVVKDAAFDSVEALAGKKIVAESGSAGETAAVEQFGEANVTGLPGQTKALFEVQAGTSDAAVVDYSIAKSLCGSGDYANLSIIESVRIGEELFAVGARKGSDLTAEVNDLFLTNFKNGKMAELQDKYGKQEDGSNSIALADLNDKISE